MSGRAQIVSLGGTGGGSLTVEQRVSALEQQWDDTTEMVGNLSAIVGKPSDGDANATGLHGLVAALSDRMSVYDKIRERSMGFASACAFFLPLIGAWAWWQYGDKLASVFKG